MSTLRLMLLPIYLAVVFLGKTLNANVPIIAAVVAPWLTQRMRKRKVFDSLILN